jgi:hypothetical protein
LTGKSLSDNGSATESLVKSIQPSISDGASGADSGSAGMTDYAETPFDYFAEDYVGTYFTFT